MRCAGVVAPVPGPPPPGGSGWREPPQEAPRKFLLRGHAGGPVELAGLQASNEKEVGNDDVRDVLKLIAEALQGLGTDPDDVKVARAREVRGATKMNHPVMRHFVNSQLGIQVMKTLDAGIHEFKKDTLSADKLQGIPWATNKLPQNRRGARGPEGEERMCGLIGGWVDG